MTEALTLVHWSRQQSQDESEVKGWGKKYISECEKGEEATFNVLTNLKNNDAFNDSKVESWEFKVVYWDAET